MKIAIACGGTGGHLFPGLAVAEELRQRGHDTLLLVSAKQIDTIALEGAKEQKAKALPGIGWPGFLSPRVLQVRDDAREQLARVRPGPIAIFSPPPSWAWAASPARFRCCSDAICACRRSSTNPTRFPAASRRLHRADGQQDAARFRVVRELSAPRPLRRHRHAGAPWPRAHRSHRCGGKIRAQPRAAHRARHGWQPGRARHQPAHPQDDRDVARRPPRKCSSSISPVRPMRKSPRSISPPSPHRRVQAFSTEMEHFYSLADVVISRSGAASLTELSHYGPAVGARALPGGGR